VRFRRTRFAQTAAPPADDEPAIDAPVRLDKGLQQGEDGIIRCLWEGSDPLYRRYHDRDWGFPVADDRRLFEKIRLGSFQSGLSWLTHRKLIHS
jgi:hypothetical protein